MNTADTSEFLRMSGAVPVIDVRAPAEFAAGHIPGALNMPLFDDGERARVGTAYKKTGRSEAIDIGLDIVGPKMKDFVRQVRELAPEMRVLVHCWRGGMRSASMAWLFETAGFQVTVLQGGYKAYRAFVRENLVKDRHFIILGGLTGSGKTRWLHMLAEAGEPVIDLEALANHRGSVFGGIGLGTQPTNEQFENSLFEQLDRFSGRQTVWLEDESRQIGSIFLPEPFYLAMTTSPLIRIDVPADLRIAVILEEYGAMDKEELAGSIRKISKRLGGLVVQESLDLLEKDDFKGVIRLLLPYYDKTYSHSLARRKDQVIIPLDLTGFHSGQYAGALIKKKLELIQ